MGRALRLLGLNITELQIREMIIEQNTPKGKLDYKQFVNALESVRMNFRITSSSSSPTLLLRC